MIEVVEGSVRVVVLRDGRVETELTGDDVDEPHLLAAIAGRDEEPGAGTSDEEGLR